MFRKLCILVVMTIITGTAVCRAGDGESVLYVYTWENYFSPGVVENFEREHRCRVEFDYFDSYDTMYERIKNGDTGYDIITPSANLAERMNGLGLVMDLDHGLVPNLRHLDHTRLRPFPDPEMRYHATYTWSINVIGYHKERVGPDMVGSWDIFSRPGFERRATLLNDPRYVIGAALKSLGHSINSVSREEIEEAGAVLRSWKRNISLLDVNQPRFKLENGEVDFIQAFSGDMALAAADNPELGFFVPREGSMVNSDYFVIPVDAESPELAHAFINHMFDPEMAARNMEACMYYMPNREAMEQLSPGFTDNPLLFFPVGDIEKSEAVQDVGDSLRIYEQVWEEFLDVD